MDVLLFLAQKEIKKEMDRVTKSLRAGNDQETSIPLLVSKVVSGGTDVLVSSVVPTIVTSKGTTPLKW